MNSRQMGRTILALGCIASLFPTQFAIVHAQGIVQKGIAARIKRGGELFNRVWEPITQTGKPDGLGPMFNANSCAACHDLGGIGGAGGRDKNIRLLTVVPPKHSLSKREQTSFSQRVARIHNGFSNGSSTRSTILLHHFSTAPEYFELHDRLLFGIPAKLDGEQKARAIKAVTSRTRLQMPVKSLEIDGVKFASSERNTTPLFGLGLIDKIPLTELEKIAAEQPALAPGVSGRVSAGGGRFGWRGQIATLEDFVLTACAAELGLEVPEHHQAETPKAVAEFGGEKPLDMTEDECESLVTFVASLPRPKRTESSDAGRRAAILNGEQVFSSIGCAVCHVPDLGGVEGVYSDLLLHDMGSDLSDPVPAAPQIVKIQRQVGTQSVSSGGYAGGVTNVFATFATTELTVPSNPGQEWKTPALWGVGSSAPYLHDGRAATLQEAILLHGGEASDSTRRYTQLPADAQARVLAFLQTLVAP